MKQPLPGQGVKSSRRKRLLLLALVCLLLLGLGLGAWWIFSPGPVEEIQSDLAQLHEKARDMKPEERREASRAINEKVQHLTPKQQAELTKDMRAKAHAKMKEHLDQFFKLPKDQQIAELKKRIREGEEHRQRMATQHGGPGGPMTAVGPGGGPAGKGPGGRNGTVRMGGRGAGGPPGGDGSVVAGPKGGPPGAGVGIVMKGGQGQKTFLDMSSPEERAQMSLYMSMAQQVRQQMGLPPGPVILQFGDPSGSRGQVIVGVGPGGGGPPGGGGYFGIGVGVPPGGGPKP